MDEQTKEVLEALQANLKALAEIDVDHLVGRTDLGELNFEQGRETLEQIKELAEEWLGYPLEMAPPGALKALAKHFEQLKSVVNDIETFSIASVDQPTQQRDQRLQNLKGHFEQTYTAAYNQRPAIVVLNKDFREPLKEARNLIVRANAEVDEQLEVVKGLRGEAEDVLRAIRDSAKREGIEKFAPLFESLAKENEEDSAWWLKAAAGFGVATAVAALALLVSIHLDGDVFSAANASTLVSKIVVLSLLYVATVWCARNYRALLHQRVVNQHRHTALLTFRTFAEGGDTPETRDAVLREATRCVFAAASTGFLGKDDETPQASIVEVLQTAARGGGSS